MKKITTAEFAALVGCEVSLLERLRRGKNPKFSPAYHEKNRCYYTDDQITEFQETYAPKNVVIDGDTAQIETSDVVDTDKSKDFLPMATAPHFDTIPQFLKGLKRWLCWQLIPADPKPKKVPMTLKNGKLVNADVTNPDNWLTFDDAINCYQQQLCSGIGFVLTDTPPKICCVDVDHCVNPDGSLNDEAKDVITICKNSFVELSQSGTGIHVWFEDNEFPGDRGRKRGNVEVYAFKRYIALTGNHVEDTDIDIKRVDKACSNVISKFIDRREDNSGNLFDTQPARTTADKKILTATADVTLTDDDVKLVNYFRSEKCRDKDSNMFDLFNGNTDAYFKNTGKVVDDSVADCDLLLKILWYIGGESGSDDDIGRHALNLFNASALAKREKWLSREDYRIMTINNVLDLWRQNGRKAREDNYLGGSAQIEDLQKELQDKNKQLAVFEDEKKKALAKFNDEILTLETFDATTLSADDVVNTIAIVRLYQPEGYTCLRQMIKAARDDGEKTIYLDDLGSKTKRRAETIKAHYDSLVARKNELIAAIRTQKFVDANQDVLAGYVIPDGYSVSAAGIEKIKAKGSELVCRRPVIIKGRVYDTDQKIFLIETSYQNAEGKWREIKPQERATIFNARKLVELSNLGLPVTSQNAGALVTYLDCFFADNEKRLPMKYIVPRCGWHEFHDTKVFIDPRRDCDIEVDDKKITCAVSDGSEFAKHLRTKGSIDEWRKAYQMAKKSIIARAVVAASVAAPLLDIVGERNFMLYLKARTRAGKTTAMLLGASAIGDEKIIRSFDSTKNGLVGAAGDVNDYAFLIDEKQVADNRLKESLTEMIYSLANGVGRTKLNRDSTLKKLQDWRTIAIATGETDLLPENATDGADTRLLTLHAPDTILSADDCKVIRGIIKDNYGLALPLVIDKIVRVDKERLCNVYNDTCDAFKETYPDVLPEHCRYMAIVTLADALLNHVVLGVENFDDALDDATLNAKAIFKLIPTAKDISATDREQDFVRGFILQNQGKFIGGNIPIERMQAIYGKLRDDDGYTYITTRALQDACKIAGFDYRKLAADLAAVGFFEPADSVEKNRKNANNTVVKRFTKDSVSARCYRIPNAILDAVKQKPVTNL